ncbi:MAG: hypothetical protein GY876_03970 [Planctomycetes bacterium]|nr:hypothetical protein [Planctomycetota bacterium]
MRGVILIDGVWAKEKGLRGRLWCVWTVILVTGNTFAGTAVIERNPDERVLDAATERHGYLVQLETKPDLARADGSRP